MKQTLFMIVATLFGTFGVVYQPFWGVAVYYLFAVLRPEFLWQWVPLPELRWSRYVAIATIAATFAASFGIIPVVPPGVERVPARFGRSQILIGLFASWIFVTYFTARNQDQAFNCLRRIHQDLRHDGSFHGVAGHLDQLYCLLLIAATTLAYIAYEINVLYLSTGYIGDREERLWRAGQQRRRVDARHGSASLYSALGRDPGPLAVVFPGPGSDDCPCGPDDLFPGCDALARWW